MLEAVDDCELMLVMARRRSVFDKQQYCVEHGKRSITEKFDFGMCNWIEVAVNKNMMTSFSEAL